MLANVGRISQPPAILDAEVAALAPAQLLQRLLERHELGTAGGGTAREYADPPDPLALLRPRLERPRCRAAEQRDERAAHHSITSSAQALSVGGISRPTVRAVGRLVNKSNLVDCITGRSLGLSPLRILPA